MTTVKTYYFIPWARSGMARLISAPVLGKGPLPAETAIHRVSVPVTVALNGQPVTLTAGGHPQLYGPEDVAGIDPREIIRTAPLHLTPDYAPEKFAFIEFDRPDFPWLFTPAKCDKDGRLRPWIVLVVVEKSKATITPATGNRLPVLSCPVTELPHRKMKENPDQLVTDLDESWAWAHAQYAGDVGESVPAKVMADLLSNDPQVLNLSRLLCPRKLKGNTPYVACLVPAFEVGRKALLGMPFNPGQEPVHWKFTKNEEVKLPVYYQWEFSTGQKDPFQELAERLKPLKEDELQSAQAGIVRDMDLSDPGNGMGTYSGKPKVPIPSALRIKGAPTTAGTIPQEFTDKLRPLLTAEKQAPIPPPVYGSWHAPAGEISAQLDSHPWLKMLNLDPRYRVAAALGTQIIQQEQEHLVAAAWEQVAELHRVNEFLVRKQLGCWVTESIHAKRLSTLSAPALSQMTKPLAVARGEKSLPTQGSASPQLPLQEVGKSPLFRRMTRGGGPWAMKGSVSKCDPEQIAPPPGATEGAKQVSGYKPTPTGDQKTTSGLAKAADAEAAGLFKQTQSLLETTKPQDTFRKEVKDRLQKGGPQQDRFQQRDPLGPVTYAPSFPQPMYEPLRDQFPDMLLPGLNKIPNDRATLLMVDAQFIEAYMVGLNHELSREFLWREFPTLVHTTYFQQFWDTRGAKDPQQRDMPPLREWNSALGTNVAKNRGTLTFLLIRGELLVRFPNALIYALPNRVKTDEGIDYSLAEYPILRVTPLPGVTLLGFDLTRPNENVWKFVIEEHLTEPYFGPGVDDPLNKYVSFSNKTNSAYVAHDTLHRRYFWTLDMVFNRATDPRSSPLQPVRS